MTQSTDPHPLTTPWSVRRQFPHPIVLNTSVEPLEYARALIRAGDHITTEHWGTVLPADENEICLCDIDTADLAVTLSWRRAGVDEELLWQFVF